MTAFSVNSAVGQASAFSSSNTLLNAIQGATRAASISNLMDVPTDCPQRERRGWLGDGEISFETVVHNFDAAAFYTKWIRDIRDTQASLEAITGGQVPDCAPFYNHGGLPADPAWSAAYPLIVDWASAYFEDSRLVERHYAGIRMYVESQLRQLEKDGLLHWARYGDWCGVAQGSNISNCRFTTPGISTFYFLRGVQILSNFAAKLGGKGEDAAHYAALAASTAAAFQALLFNSTLQAYEGGYPVSQLMALALGEGTLTPTAAPALEAAFGALEGELTMGTLSGFPLAPTGGIVFQKLAYPILSQGGRMDLALDLMLSQRGMPGVAYWFDSAVQTTPATTLWERWQSTATSPRGWSFNHIMFGGYRDWLFWGLGGLGRQKVGGNSSSSSSKGGWDALDIAPPQPLPPRFNLTSAIASVDTALGLAVVDWEALNASQALCGSVEENPALPNGTSLTLTCKGGGRFTGVAFASFGTPLGVTCPYTLNASCHAPTSVSVVAGLCVGKDTCTIPASDTAFGGDPCPEVKKSLAVQLQGEGCSAPSFLLRTAIPVGGGAVVRVPLGGGSPLSANITEGGVPVWVSGVFQPGAVVGVMGGAPDGKGYVAFEVGGGEYVFELVQAAT